VVDRHAAVTQRRKERAPQKAARVRPNPVDAKLARDEGKVKMLPHHDWSAKTSPKFHQVKKKLNRK
jgi:hypothetical protein